MVYAACAQFCHGHAVDLRAHACFVGWWVHAVRQQDLPESSPAAARNCTMMFADVGGGGGSPSLACFAGGSATSVMVLRSPLFLFLTGTHLYVPT